MNRRATIRWAWFSGICLLGLALLFWPRARPASVSSGLTRAEANRQAAAALREIQHNLAPVPAPPPAGEPAIRLRAETIRPGMDFGSVAHLRPSARGYPWLVLFDGPIQPEWQVALENAGATLRAYLPDNAWLVELPAGRREDVRTLPHVAWSGEYRPGHKIQPLLAGLARQHPGAVW